MWESNGCGCLESTDTSCRLVWFRWLTRVGLLLDDDAMVLSPLLCDRSFMPYSTGGTVQRRSQFDNQVVWESVVFLYSAFSRGNFLSPFFSFSWFRVYDGANGTVWTRYDNTQHVEWFVLMCKRTLSAMMMRNVLKIFNFVLNKILFCMRTMRLGSARRGSNIITRYHIGPTQFNSTRYRYSISRASSSL